MPFCHITLRRRKPFPPGFPRVLHTIGDHLRSYRLKARLHQRELAERLGVCTETVRNWEMGYTVPTLRLMPAIVHFLGYAPVPAPEGFPERLRTYRLLRGLPREGLAEQLKVDTATISGWEAGRHKPLPRHKKKVEALIGPFLDQSFYMIGPLRVGAFSCEQGSRYP